MKSIIIILPYFGKFPNYFPLFLKSCSYNSSIKWLLVSDNKVEDDLPVNFIYKNMEFSIFRNICLKKYGYAPTAPYDCCKFRAVYHELFASDVSGFDFWGFCDCDLIMGNLREFITDNILNSYDKISWRGHLTLVKNIDRVNEAYRTEIPGGKTFRGCISGTDGLNLFDEVGLNKIFDYLKYPIYKNLPIADLKIRSFNFKCMHKVFNEESNKNQIFMLTPESLKRCYLLNNEVRYQNVAYVHFLKRDMEVQIPFDSDSFLIIPNKFVEMKDEITPTYLKKVSRQRIYVHYFLKRLNIKTILTKFKSLTQKAEVDEYGK